jgi:predicted amidohydrolase
MLPEVSVWVLSVASAAPPARYLEVGADAGRGNIVAVQAWVEPADYASAATLRAALAPWLDEARARGWLGPSTVVVLPEYLGTWLVAAGEPAKVRAAATTGEAMGLVAKRHLLGYLAARRGPAEDRATYGLFALRAPDTARAWQEVGSDLARTYGVTLVAGSALLPDPAVTAGHLAPTPGGALRNVALVFGPDGGIRGSPVVKSFPTADEQPFVTAGPVAPPVVDTPAGRVAVLVCADGWFPAAWDAAAAAGAEWAVVPQFTSGDGAWSRPWGGYSGWDAPPDVDPADVGAIAEGEAWARYGPTARAAARGLDAVTAPLRGDLWDLGDDGQIRWVVDGVPGEGPLYDGPVVVSLWRRPVAPPAAAPDPELGPPPDPSIVP